MLPELVFAGLCSPTPYSVPVRAFDALRYRRPGQSAWASPNQIITRRDT
jgi:hypothetical protein